MIVPGVPIVIGFVVVPVLGVPPDVKTLRLTQGLAAIKPLTVRFPPIVEILDASIDPIDKSAVESMDNALIPDNIFKSHFSGETKESITG